MYARILGLTLFGLAVLPAQAVEVDGWEVQRNGASACLMWATFDDGSIVSTGLNKKGEVELTVSSKSWRFSPESSYQRAMITLDVVGMPDAFPVAFFAPSRAWQGELELYADLESDMEPAFLSALAASGKISIQIEVAGRTFSSTYRTQNPVAAIAELRRCTAARPG